VKLADSFIHQHYRTYLFDVIPTSHRFHKRPNLFIDSKFNPHARKRSENIREENTPIRLVVSPGLKRHFDCDFGNLGTFAKGGPLFTQVSVFLNVATGLTHHPHRCSFRLFTASGANQKWVLCSAALFGRCRRSFCVDSTRQLKWRRTIAARRRKGISRSGQEAH
jgi:hypothetical protein